MISMREAYEKIGANYDDACARLMGEPNNEGPASS